MVLLESATAGPSKRKVSGEEFLRVQRANVGIGFGASRGLRNGRSLVRRLRARQGDVHVAHHWESLAGVLWVSAFAREVRNWWETGDGVGTVQEVQGRIEGNSRGGRGRCGMGSAAHPQGYQNSGIAILESPCGRREGDEGELETLGKDRTRDT